MQLTQEGDRVEGAYEFKGIRCTLAGRVENGRLVFTYREPSVRGEGWFVMIRPGRFAGQWHSEHESDRWLPWEGSRPFDGLWDSSFGPMRLIADGERVHGVYGGAVPCSIEGSVQDDRLTFRYREPTAQGEGYFDLDPVGEGFAGQWRADGATQAAPWEGRRVHPMPGRVWLVVLEAYWQRGLIEPDFSFGAMLGSLFARLPHVGVRHRFFRDAVGLERWLRDVTYLAEPVAIVLAGHGDEEGLTIEGKPVDPARIVGSLRYADNLRLLHFSACWMLHEGKSGELARALQRELGVPVSGYDHSVDWAASALIEFHLLDMVLRRDIDPAEAARLLPQLIGYAGDGALEGSPYPAAGFRMLLPER
jgi:hypothetical protein